MKKVEEHIPTSVFDTEKHDEELRATYGSSEQQKPSFLYVERGPGAGQLVQLKQGPLVIGRASVSDLRLQHPSISRRHAQFKRIGEQFFVKDLGSQNGTFVNKNKIETEIEVFPGDLIAMGNALLKLRGPLTKGEALPAPAKDNKVSTKKAAMKTSIGVPATRANPVPKQKSSSMVKVAIFAGAMGFGLAGVLAFALVKGVGNNGPVKIAAKGTPKAAEPEMDIAVDDVKVQQNKKVDEAISRKMQEKQAAAAAVAAEKKALEKEKEPPAEAAPSEDRRPKPIAVAKATPSKKGADEEEEAPAPKAASPSAKKAAILSAYEKGNAEGSLDAAKKANDKELTTRLTEFISVYEAADNAVNSNNGGAAIKNFEKALKLDEQLSSGWGVYGGKIRKQLSNLYTLVGLQHVKNDNSDNAKIAFQAALKNDPDNDRAKSQLAKLGGSAKDDSDEEEKPAPKKKAAAAPSKKPAAEPKSRSQAIDDAFGD